MSYKRKPIYQFKDTAETGSDKIPLNRIVYIESENNIYKKDNNTGLTGSSTITDAIIGNNLILISGGSGDIGGLTGLDRTETTATAGQDTFNITYMPGMIEVAVNGFALYPSDWTEDEGVSIVLDTPLVAGDDVLFTTYGLFEENGISQTEYDSSFLYDASNMNEINCEVNTVISGTDTLDSTVVDTTNRQDSSWTSTTTEIYLDNRYVNAEVGETVTTDQGDLIIKEIHDDGGYDYDEFGHNGFGTFSKQPTFIQTIAGSESTIYYKLIDGNIYVKNNSNHQAGVYASGAKSQITMGWEYTGVSGVEALYIQGPTEKASSWFYTRKSDLRLFARGRNFGGELGLGDTSVHDIWTDTGIDNVVKVSAFSLNASSHTSILKNDGTVWVSGKNAQGQLGLGDTTDRTTFVQNTATSAVDIFSTKTQIQYIDSSSNCYRSDSAGVFQLQGTDGLRFPLVATNVQAYEDSYINTLNQYIIDATIEDTNVKKVWQVKGATTDQWVGLRTDNTISRHPSTATYSTYNEPVDDIIVGVSASNNEIVYPGILYNIDGQLYESVFNQAYRNGVVGTFKNSGLTPIGESVPNASKYFTKYWVTPETPLASAPSTAYLNTHRAKSPYSYQDEFQNSFGAFKNTKVTISKVDFIDTGKTSTLTKVFFDASTEVRVNEEFCSQTGETFVLQDIQTDGTGYWGTPSSVLNTAPTAVYGLASIKFNNTLAAQGTAIIGTNIEQNFETTTAASRKFRLNIHQTDTVQVSEIKGDIYRIA